MMANNNIIDVNDVDFEFEVVAYSQNTPVLVDFWAEWCQPCKILSPLLERLTAEAAGKLRLAKVNVDQNPNLSKMFNVRSIPTVVAFSQGKPVAETVGLQPEQKLRDFIASILPPSEVELEIEKGNTLLTMEKWADAAETFEHVRETSPDSTPAMLGLAKSLLASGQGNEALKILSDFPGSRELDSAERLLPLARTLVKMAEKGFPTDSALDAAFANCIRLAGLGKLEVALDGLMDILRQDKKYHDKLAQEVVLAILEIMGNDNPQTREYRVELSTILF